jgi:hypothetical protein
MKKIIASAVGLALVGGVAVTTASAVESQFGGYWRTRFTYDDNMTGTAAGTNLDGTTFGATNDSGSNYVTDTRTRLYYTAKFNDDFKFVNRFEFNTTWGDIGKNSAGMKNGGGVGSDGTNNFRIKHSYADFTLGNVNSKIGMQGVVISRGFIFDDDFSGAVITPTFGDVKVPLVYIAAVDEEATAGYQEGDVNIISAMPTFKISDTFSLTPHATYMDGTSELDTDLYWLGVDLDMKFDTVSAWGTFIYNGGESGDTDISAFLGAVGADAGIVHGQVFYATGDDNDVDSDDYDGYIGAPGQSYYWSEIMGMGVFDNSSSNGSPGAQVTNILAANLGVSLKPADKMTFDFDVWYAMLDQENVNGDDNLGLEFDAKLTYELMENLNADFIFAYLVADDATGDDDVMEGGVRLSLKF